MLVTKLKEHTSQIANFSERSAYLKLRESSLDIINKYLPDESILNNLEKEDCASKISLKAVADLFSYVKRDPATKGNWQFVLKTYHCFMAVLCYRIANYLYYYPQYCVETAVTVLQEVARQISEDAKVKTGVEIHPAAQIGKAFVLDHGTGTVIGETTVIGDYCYLLQNVTLGANGIANNPTGKRHPTLGNYVEIGANVKIFGQIKVGNFVKISPGSVLIQDIPSRTNVVMTNQYQIIKSEYSHTVDIYGIVPKNGREIWIEGIGLQNKSVEIVNENHQKTDYLNLEIIEQSNHLIRCLIKILNYPNIPLDNMRLRIQENNQEVMTIVNALGFKRLCLSLMSSNQ